MKEEKKESEVFAARIRVRKRVTVLLFVVVVFFTFLFLGDSHYYDGIEQHGVGLGLDPIIIVAVVAVECIVCVIFYSRAEDKVNTVLDEQCDPKLYYAIKRTLMKRGSYIDEKQIVDLNVSYYLGDFASCIMSAEDTIRSSGDVDKIYGYSYLGMASFMNGEDRSLSDAFERGKRLLERARLRTKTQIYADLSRRIKVLEMLCLLIDKEMKTAASLADSLELLPSGTTKIERYNTVFLRGMVYNSSGEREKSLECFNECISGTEKTFIFEEANKMINR